jgi:hypothetical protein
LHAGILRGVQVDVVASDHQRLVGASGVPARGVEAER